MAAASQSIRSFGPIHQPKKHPVLHCCTLIQELKGISFAYYHVWFHQSFPLQTIVYSLPKDTRMQATKGPAARRVGTKLIDSIARIGSAYRLSQ